MSIEEPARIATGFRGRARASAIDADDGLVRTSRLDTLIPLVVEPRASGVDLVAWGRAQRAWVSSLVAEHGAVLFRHFDVRAADRFSAFIEAISQRPLTYQERSSPRREIGDRIYTSTEHPREQTIFLHNEQSYNLVPPRMIAFFCREPATAGGATPIADCRRVLARIPQDLRADLDRRRYAYVRTFGTGYGLTWQEAFQCSAPDEVEAYCRANGLEWEWLEDGLLRTRQVRQVTARHPITGALTWFNHLTFFHVSTLPDRTRALLQDSLPPDRLPNHTTYGDGAAIPDEIVATLRAAYAAETMRFAWQSGDILVLDNLLVAHGRDPFEGSRQVLVAMADPTPWTEIGLAPSPAPTSPAPTSPAPTSPVPTSSAPTSTATSSKEHAS